MSRIERGSAFRLDQAATQLNIVHVVRQFAPGIGGLEEFTYQLATRQAAAGHKVRVVTLDRIFGSGSAAVLPPSEHMGEVEVVRIPYFGSQRYPIAPKVLAHVRDCDIIHVHGVDFFVDFLAATRLIHRKPMIVTTHGGFFHTGFASRLKKIYFATITRASLTQFGAITACSAEDERTFAPIVDERLKLVRNPVDIDKFAGAADPSARTLIYFGRFAPNKRIEQVIAWYAGLHERGTGWKLIVAGKPMGVTVDQLTRAADTHGVAASVEIHAEPSVDELRELIGRSSTYVCASSYEGFGLAAVEAASAGLFPVLSNIPPFEDTVRQLGFGFTLDFDDSASWQASYDRLEADLGAFRAAAGRDSHRTALEPFAWSGSVPKFEALYRDLLGEQKRRVGPVNIDVVAADSAREKILGAASQNEPMLVAFCNAHSVNVAASDGELCGAMEEALVLNDGVGVDLASKVLFGKSFPDNLNGTDFVPSLFSVAQQPLRVFLLGAKPGVASRAADAIKRRYPKLTIAGVEHGFFDKNNDEALVEKIKASDANLVLVALGQPLQETWARRHFRRFGGPTLCVGALFDFLAGEAQRAPSILRKLRLEWLYRLMQEPARLGKRYLVGNVTFLMRLTRQAALGGRI